jgi:hypothetical protein
MADIGNRVLLPTHPPYEEGLALLLNTLSSHPPKKVSPLFTLLSGENKRVLEAKPL